MATPCVPLLPFAGRVEGVRVAVRAASHQATYEAGLRSFINEARMLARFSHPSLVEVYRFWEGNGTAYVAMRYYEGDTLRQHLARGDMVFDEATIAQTMSPVFDALEMLHREQVFHRDIAPDNIILSGGHSVLLDFGSARRIIGDGIQALTTVLKPGYAPIEQYVDDGTMKQGPWTDLYALAGVMYWLVTGQLPTESLARLREDPMPAASAIGKPEVFGKAMLRAIDWALTPDENQRPLRVADFRRACLPAAGGDARAEAGAAVEVLADPHRRLTLVWGPAVRHGVVVVEQFDLLTTGQFDLDPVRGQEAQPVAVHHARLVALPGLPPHAAHHSPPGSATEGA